MVVLVTLALPATAAAAGFSFGVAAGDVTSSSAILWARSNDSGPVTLRLSRSNRVVQRHNLTAAAADDNTVRVRVRRLRPFTTYRYQFFAGPTSSETGTFRTAPPPSRRRTIRFAYSGDADGISAPGTGQPYYNNFEVYARMQAERNAFNVNLGDTIYSDSELTGSPVALTLADKWAKYRQNLAFLNLAELRRSAALYSHWDDHEFANDFSVPELGAELYQAGTRRFSTMRRPATRAETVSTDTFAGGGISSSSCSTSGRSEARRHPTVPPATTHSEPERRPGPHGSAAASERVRLRDSSAEEPGPQACLDPINDPNRTFLGPRQLRRFKRDVRRSHGHFKLVINETPIQQFYALPYDRWEGYAAERDKLLRFLGARPATSSF